MKILLLSGKAESGKDTFYSLARGNSTMSMIYRLAFADEVKKVSKMMGWNGEKDDNGRSGLIMVGDGARKYFDPNVWINKVIEHLEQFGSSSIVVVTDCRYPNEIEMLKDWAANRGVDAYAIRIERTNHVSRLTEEQRSNLSEIALDDYGPWDYIIVNNDGLEEYKDGVKTLLDDILK